MPRPKKPHSPFRYFNSSPEVIRQVVMMYVRFPLSLRNVEDLLLERGIDICHETVRHWGNRFGPMFAGPTTGRTPTFRSDDERDRAAWESIFRADSPKNPSKAKWHDHL